MNNETKGMVLGLIGVSIFALTLPGLSQQRRQCTPQGCRTLAPGFSPGSIHVPKTAP